MAVEILVLVVVVAFLALLGVGRRQIAQGTNAQVANGATVLVLATVVGVLALGIVLSLDVW